MPSPVTMWALICVWTAVGGIFVGFVMDTLRRISRALDCIATTYCASERFKVCPTCNGPDSDDKEARACRMS